jgi:two-component system sensor histidine kinase FlrB
LDVEPLQAMTTDAQLSPEALQNAFRDFNQLSNQLASSYQALEQRVLHLNEELHRTQDARIRELTEKERLANRLSTLLQALPGGVVALDRNGVVQEFNSAAVELLGEPLAGVSWAQVIQRAFAPRSDDGHDVSLADGRRVNISTCPMINEPGQILLLTDVTEMRALQDRLSQQQRLVAMGEMAASLAHQIRTPLASAMLYTSHLRRPGLKPDDHARFCDKVRSRLAHLEHIVTDMLLYARSNNIGAQLSFRIHDLLIDLEHNLDAQLLQSHCHYAWRDETQGVTLVGNQQMLLSALTNLGMNALQAMGEAGQLLVIARHSGQAHIEIVVSDNGPGIATDKLQHIFDPFFTTRADGTGLGLAVVRAIVNAHKGEIAVDSQPGKGTTFVLRLPLLVESIQQSESTTPDTRVYRVG